MKELLLKRLFKRGMTTSKDFIEVKSTQGDFKATDTKRTVKTAMYIPHNIDEEWKKKMRKALGRQIYLTQPHVEVVFDLRVDRFFTAEKLPESCSSLFDNPKQYIVIDGGQVLPTLEVGGVIIHHGLEGVPCFFKRRHFKLAGNEEEQKGYLERIRSLKPRNGKYIYREPELTNGKRNVALVGKAFKEMDAEFEDQ